MRIIIEDCADEKIEKKPAPEMPEGAPTAEGATPPEDLAARAAALGASSAGPAPAAGAIEEPAPFVADPGQPETALEDMRATEGMSAGGAPEFAAGSVEVAEAQPAEEGEAESDETD